MKREGDPGLAQDAIARVLVDGVVVEEVLLGHRAAGRVRRRSQRPLLKQQENWSAVVELEVKRSSCDRPSWRRRPTRRARSSGRAQAQVRVLGQAEADAMQHTLPGQKQIEQSRLEAGRARRRR
jgi:hypothetical protein